MHDALKRTLRNIPGLEAFLLRLRPKGDFRNSGDYWEQRYQRGGNSGSGSYSRLAEFKADVLNTFVDRHGVTSVVEFGCGDGAQLALARYPSYTGVDISSKAVELCRAKFANDPSRQFCESSSAADDLTADLALSLDVIYHLVEDKVFHAYMRRLFRSARRFVIIYASNMDQRWPDRHVRHRHFTRWVERNAPAWRLHSCIKNAYPFDPENPTQTSFADFYVFEPARPQAQSTTV